MQLGRDSDHSRYMQLALDEAAKARGRTRPNPMVGAVVVKDGAIVAIGHHRRAGTHHAEVVALRKAGARARGADLYVNLEPCDHHGRTAPCTAAVIEAGIARVVVAIRDPNPIVDGRGLRRLRRAGIAVEVGVLAEEATRLNEPFIHRMRHGRPLVVAKLAMSLDGRVATRQGESQWITGDAARRRGHALRDEHDAILVGIGTVLDDDPQLTCRVRGGRDPVRIVLDTHARTPPRARLVREAARSTAPTWIVVGRGAPARRVAALAKVPNVQVLVERTLRGRIDLRALLQTLTERELLSMLVEGGPEVLGGFFDAHLVDKVHAFVAPTIIGGRQARSAVEARGAATLDQALRLRDLVVSRVGADLELVGYPRRE